MIRDGVVIVERRVRAPREDVYSYLTSATRWALWQGIAAEIDPSPGGWLAVTMPNGDVAAGTFVELVQDRRVVFTWGWSGHPTIPPGSSTVEIELIDDDDGTLIRLSHRDLPLDATDLHDAGWIRYLERLGAAADGLPIGADAVVDP
ncbi:MAG: SRPBCC family protein [Chloroflexota bacterium]